MGRKAHMPHIRQRLGDLSNRPPLSASDHYVNNPTRTLAARLEAEHSGLADQDGPDAGGRGDERRRS
jgi:hypothetical protein